MHADRSVLARAAFDHAIGLAPAVGGLLLTDPGEFTFDGTGDDGRLWYASRVAGDATVLGTGIPKPNFVAAAPRGGALVKARDGHGAQRLVRPLERLR